MSKKYVFYQICLTIVYIAFVIAFCYMSLQDGGESSSTSQKVAEGVAQAQEAITGESVVVDDDYITIIRKALGHFGFFLIFGIVSAMLYLSLYTLKPFYRVSIHYVSGIELALISEFIFQASSDGRGPSFKDVLIDSGGFIAISTIIILIWGIIKYKRSKRALVS